MTATVETQYEAAQTPVRPGGYGHFVATAFHQTLRLLAHRRRTILALLIAFSPVLLPVAMAALGGGPNLPRGQEIFIALIEKLYLRGITPLLALFFGCMLIGEDIESHTIHYVLCRPVPRSAWVLGKFLGYCVFTVCVLVPAVALLFLACTTLGAFSATASNLKLLAHYLGVLCAAVAVYGAFSMLLGAFAKRPVVYAILYLFVAQRFAVTVPGVIDFLSLEKYLFALLPPLAIQRDNPDMQGALAEFQQGVFVIGAWKAAIVLAVAVVVFLVLTTVVVRYREFTAARAAGT